MRIFDTIYMAALNLYRRWARSLLTVIGVIIGTASIVIMIAIGYTNLLQFDEIFEKSELTKIEIMAPNETMGQRVLRLDDVSIAAFGELQHVEIVVPIKYIQAYAEVDRYHADYLHIIGVPVDGMPKLAELQKGRYPSAGSSMPELIMGRGAASNFIQSIEDYRKSDYAGPSLDWLKTPVDIYLGGNATVEESDMPSSRRYRSSVVGIIEDEDEEYRNHDIYISLDSARRIIQENYKLSHELGVNANTYDSAYVYVDEMSNVKDVLSVIRSYGFEAWSNTQWIEEVQRQQRAQQNQLAAIGLISLIVSAIGIANTMMTGVLERRREIGVMKVVGISIRKIRLLFLVESAIIGLIGGLIGVASSHLFTYILSTKTGETVFLGMYFDAGMKITIPLWLDLGAIAIAVIVGIVAGIFPATKATNMSPLEAIRG